MRVGNERGSIELVALGMLAALICLLAFPLFGALLDGHKPVPLNPQIAKIHADAIEVPVQLPLSGSR